MKRLLLSAHIGLLMVGITATAALLLEARLPVPQDIHFLLQLLWVGVAMGGVFVVMMQPAINLQSQPDSGMNLDTDDVPEWHDSDRVWMQQHPNERYLGNDIDREEA